MILKEVQLQENGKRFKIFVMIYSGLVLVFSGFHWECLRLAKQLQPLTRDAEARAIAKIIVYTIHYFHKDHDALCLPAKILHKKSTFTKQNNCLTPV